MRTGSIVALTVCLLLAAPLGMPSAAFSRQGRGGLPAGSQHPARGRLAGEWVSTVSGVLGSLGDLEMESI